MKVISENKRIKFDYEIIETLEAGIVLQGWEVKSIKDHKITIENSFIKNKGNELFLINAIVQKYKYGYTSVQQIEDRERKLLLNSKQIKHIIGTINNPGNSAVAFKVINKNGLIKLVVALVKGKKKYDKRNKLKEKDLKRRIDIERKNYNL